MSAIFRGARPLRFSLSVSLWTISFSDNPCFLSLTGYIEWIISLTQECNNLLSQIQNFHSAKSVKTSVNGTKRQNFPTRFFDKSRCHQTLIRSATWKLLIPWARRSSNSLGSSCLKGSSKMRHTTSQETKFYIFDCHLPPHIFKKMAYIVVKIPKVYPYDTLKCAIPTQASNSKKAELRQLASYSDSDHQSPSCRNWCSI